MQASTEPKLFVGGLPPGTSEEEIKQIFEPYGEVEEVFLMRGGSRSGMACCFVRYAAPEEAAAAIQAVHGKLVPTGATDPLVVRYADTPGSGRGRKERGGGGSAGQQAAAAQAAAMMGGLGLGGYAPGFPMPFGAFPRGSVQEQYAAAAAAYGLPIGMGVFQGPPGFNPYGAPARIFAAAPMGAMGGLQGMAGLYAPGLLAANPQLLAVGAAPAGPGAGLGLQLSPQQQQAAQQMHAQQHLQIQMQAQQQHLRALQQHAVGGGAAVPGPRGPTSPLRAAAPAVCGRGSSGAGGGSGTGATSPSAAVVGASPLGAAEAAAVACSTQALQAHVGQQRGAAAASPGAATLPSQATSWAPYTSPDGRTYYYNSQTGVSTWEKPT